MISPKLITLCIIAISSMLCQWIAWKIKKPSIVLLLPCGILLGPITHILSPDKLLGDLLFPITSLAVSIILFEGSLTLKFSDISRSKSTIIKRLISIGYLLTMLVMTVAAHLLFSMPWQLSLLLAAITSISGPTVVTPILRSIRLKQPLSHILRWEGILIDPIGVIYAVLIFSLTMASIGNGSFLAESFKFIESLAFGIFSGLLAATIFAFFLIKEWLPKYLQNITCLALIFLIYTTNSYLSEGAGLLAVTVMGITLTNLKAVHIEDILNFKESLSLLLISGLFLILASRLDLSQSTPLIAHAFIFFIVSQLIARPLSVFITTFKSNLHLKEKLMLALICPRGIVCAAMASLFSLELIGHGYPQAQPFVIIAFILILSTVVFQSLSARWIAKKLNLCEPSSHGVIIIGANKFARALSQAFIRINTPSLIIDSNWRNISLARLEGLNTFFGDPLSIETIRQVPIHQFQTLLALRPGYEYNQSVRNHYRSELRANQCFQLPPSQTINQHTPLQPFLPSPEHLFSGNLNFSNIHEALDNGAKVRVLNILNYQDLQSIERDQHTPLFTINRDGNVQAFTNKVTPKNQFPYKLIIFHNHGEHPNESI